MIVSKDDIISIIPQREPMVMIGSLLKCSEEGSETEFLIEKENMFCENGFFSESGIIENIAQTAAAQVGYICKIKNIPVPIGFIGAIKNLEVVSLPKVNEKIITRVRVENEIMGVTIISGIVFCNDQMIASTEMKIVIKK